MTCEEKLTLCITALGAARNFHQYLHAGRDHLGVPMPKKVEQCERSVCKAIVAALAHAEGTG